LSLVALFLDNAVEHQLTFPAQQELGDFFPAISPNGGSLAFVREASIGGPGRLLRLDLTSDLKPKGEPRPLAHPPGSLAQPAWTADGKRVLFLRQGTLFQTPADGEGAAEELVLPGERAWSLATSDRPGRLAYQSNVYDDNIWRIDLKENETVSEPYQFLVSTRRDLVPQVSPDGAKIAFASSRSGAYEVWLANRDGSGVIQITANRDVFSHPRWSPDGQRLAVVESRNGNTDVAVMGAGGGPAKRLTNHPATDYMPTWSRDGRWIYFSSNRSGEYRIWKVPSEGGDATPVTRGIGSVGIESADGRFIYFSASTELRKPRGEIWRAPANGGEEIRVIEGLNRWANFAVFEDGIYFIGSPDGKSPPAVHFYRFSTERIEHVARVPRPGGLGFTVSPDRQMILYVQVDSDTSDLMLVENFR
jgi:Tol biopolymer transport system component